MIKGMIFKPLSILADGKEITKADLDSILTEHREWLKSDGTKGKRADLSGADLSKANVLEAILSKATLVRADLSNATIMEANLRNADRMNAD